MVKRTLIYLFLMFNIIFIYYTCYFWMAVAMVISVISLPIWMWKCTGDLFAKKNGLTVREDK